MKFISNVSNVNDFINLEQVVGVSKPSDTPEKNIDGTNKPIKYRVKFAMATGGQRYWTFSTAAKRDAAFNNIVTQLAATAIAEA